MPSIEIATRAADHFTRIYYAAYDGNNRLADLPHFYRSSSSLTWNGTPFQGTEGLIQMVSDMPATKHEVQSFDCHPIPGQSDSVSNAFAHNIHRNSATFSLGDCLRECCTRSWSSSKSPRYTCSIHRRPTSRIFPDLYPCSRRQRCTDKARRSSQILRWCRCVSFCWLINP